MFITFEGIEGSGKSTQLKLLENHLRAQRRDVVTTREPGGTPIGDQIRMILLQPQNTGMVGVAELLLYAAARAQHLQDVIRPALERNQIVLCDRYVDATNAYQGGARKISKEDLKEVHRISTRGLMPDLTLLFDSPVELGLQRARARNREDAAAHEARFEEELASFHERVRKGYLDIARAEPKRVKIIDATETIEVVHQQVIAYVEKYSRT